MNGPQVIYLARKESCRPTEETCEEVLGQFAKAGINVDTLAAQLQDEGAKSFVKSWNELMGVIESKTATIREAARVA